MRHAAVVCLLVFAHTATAAPKPDLDKTEAPYFVVDGAAPGVESMPLESTRADVHIAGVISDVKVTQTYRNDGDQTISARYVFPASTRAAVYGMKMTIGDRVIVADVKEREQAKAEYDAAKAAGKTASLLEEDRPNVFTMNVANILPKDRIQVELEYTELLVPTDGVYEMVYPTVVGPRYVGEHAANASFAHVGYTHAGEAPRNLFDIHVTLDAGMPIQLIDSPSHKISSQLAADKQSATIGLDASDSSQPGNRDFVLRYALAGKDIASGLMLYQGAKENYFLAMVQPPARPAPESIPPREYVFVVDVSGSMEGFPLHTAKALMSDLLGRLRPTDRFDVVLFSGATAIYAQQSVQADADQINRAEAFVDATRAGGGTELLAAVQTAMKLPKTAGMSRSFVVITDGYIAEEPAVFDEIRSHLDEANVFSFGIGSSVNRHLMEGVAKAGQGEAFIVEDEQEAAVAAVKFRQYVETPVLAHVAVSFDGFDAYDVQPQKLPDVFASRPVVVFGKYKGTPHGALKLTGDTGNGRFLATLDASAVKPDANNHALEQLWARMKISELSDFYNDEANQKEVTALGLQYHLLTKFTSFIAVQQIVRAATGSVDVDQPLPMPAGVSDSAVPDMAQGDEPPFLLVMLGAVLAMVVARKRRFA
ncbi:MAG TPA: VIT domain-containing protein [Kofleriaceae bacterium]|jgi:Ca-activated chloride channel family protein